LEQGSSKPLKTGAGEGIRTLDPNLGKIRLYEILFLNQIVILLLKNPNTIRTFSAAFSQKALCSGFQTNAERQLCAQLKTFVDPAGLLKSGHLIRLMSVDRFKPT
jgi:hypothetical protein